MLCGHKITFFTAQINVILQLQKSIRTAPLVKIHEIFSEHCQKKNSSKQLLIQGQQETSAAELPQSARPIQQEHSFSRSTIT